jgi:hypothetical protein
LSDDGTQSEVSIGKLFEDLDEIRENALRIGTVTTEIYEKQIAAQVSELANVVADVVYLVREHLSCHDCRVVDHAHVGNDGVERVFDGVVDRVDE